MRSICLAFVAATLASASFAAAQVADEDATYNEQQAFDACLRVGNTRPFCEADRQKARDEASKSAAERSARLKKQHDEQVQQQAEVDRARAEQAYLNVYLARRQALLLASAELCIAKDDKALAEASLRDERAAGRISGVVDKTVLYDASQEIIAADRRIKELTAQMKRVLRKAPMACTAVTAMVDQLQCVIGEGRCDEHLRESSALTLGWLAGTNDLEALETQLRAKVSPAFIEAASDFERRVAAAFSQP